MCNLISAALGFGIGFVFFYVVRYLMATLLMIKKGQFGFRALIEADKDIWE